MNQYRSKIPRQAKWIKILAILSILMLISETYLLKDNIKNRVVQTSSSRNVIRMLMKSNFSVDEIRLLKKSNCSVDEISEISTFMKFSVDEIKMLTKSYSSLTKSNTSVDEIRMLMKSNSSEDEIRMLMKSNFSVDEIRTLMKSNASVGEIRTLMKPKEIRFAMIPGSSVNRKIMSHNEAVLQKSTCRHKITSNAGRLVLNLKNEKFETLESLFASTVAKGGRYRPPHCTSAEKVAIILPFRDREDHLKIFLRHMHPFLQRQELEYGIFVIEMDQHIRFNRAILLNIGFLEAMKVYNFTCFVFHDVDLLPEDDRISYSCTSMPQHLSTAVDTLNYTLPQKNNFGGVTSLKTEKFRQINGMSNMFFGWGGEDDDLSQRVRLNNWTIVRPSHIIGRYKMIDHNKDLYKNPQRFCLLKSTEKRMKTDGLSNLKYLVKELEYRPLYTSLLVQVNETEQIRLDSDLFKIYQKCVNKSKKKTGTKDKLKNIEYSTSEERSLNKRVDVQ